MPRIPKPLAALLLALAPLPAIAQLPAFPGAEGYGSIATGGRGGDVYYVTNLNASGAGSLAEGVSTSPPAGRTILFKVSGHIRPSSTLTVRRNNITIAGQTAPGDGICIAGKATNFIGSDLVIRNIRFRYGKLPGSDAVNVGAANRIIFDHCDVMFSTDENMSSFGAVPEHMTFQWSTNAWGLSGHSCGGLWKVKHATAHHTLWANNHTRNPKLIGGEVFDWVNNLTFGWNHGFNMAPDSTGGLGITHRVNIRNSSFVHGASTSSAIYGGALNDDGSTKFKLHMADSALDGNNNGILDVSRTNYQMVSSTGYSQTATAWPQTHLGDPANPVIGTPVTVSPRLTGYKKIMSKTGAVRMEIGSRPLRDEITQLCITRAANLQRGIISDPLELNLSTGTSFADLKSDPAPLDTDLDGMPDDWEEAVGYDKDVANNNNVMTEAETANSFFPAGSPAGYTQLEEYLHFKAVPHGTIGKNTAASPSFIDIDLRKYTSGFHVLPVFTLSNIYGGTTTQSGPGGTIVRFTPPLDTSGRAGFNFTVTDAAGDTWTQQCCLLISTQPQPRPVTWIGNGTTNTWDSTTANFSSILGPTAFANNDAVTIDDSGSNTPTIKVTGALSPASLTVTNSTKDLTLQGTGSLAATGRFIKSGTGTLTISNTGPNTFTAATLEGGTLSLTIPNALGSAPISFTSGTLAFSADQSSALVIGGSVAINPSGTGNRTMSGAWSGSGTINLTNTGSNLLTLGGSMANFSGELSLGTSTGNVRLYGNTGSATAAFDLGSSTVTLFTRNGGTSFNLGSLTGASGTTLSGASATTTVTTYTVGALDTSTTFNGRITDGGQGATALTKTGSGTLTLTGNSTHTGSTHINSGTLALLGNFASSPTNIAANATLTGTGTMGGTLSTTAGGIISPGTNEGAAAGTLTAASLNLISPALLFDLSSNPTTGNDRIHVTGDVTLTGNQNFIFHLTDDILTPGTYDLITTTGPVTATGATLTSNLPTNTRQTLTLETHAGGVRLVVSGNQGNLTWTGANGALWNQQTTASWSGASPATFFNFDKVTFDDSASNGSVTITHSVAPQSITVHNTAARPYTFTGAPITGTAALVKSGPGSLTLNVSRVEKNDFAITADSLIVTVGSTTGLHPGMTVVSPTNTSIFPLGTTIVSIDSPTSFTLSQNSTVTSTAIKLIFESRNTFSGGTILNDGSLTLNSTSTQTYSASFPPPANAFGLGSGPITLNGGILNLYGHSLDTRLLGGPLPNDLIVPAGKSATLRSTRRGTYLKDLAGLSGSLTGSGTLNLIVNFSSAAITGDWSEFSGTLNVTRPTTAIDDPRFQLGNSLGLPLSTVNLDQATLVYTAASPPEGVVIPIGSLSGTANATTIIAGTQTGFGPVTWQVGSLNTSTTFAGNFTPYGNAPIGLEKVGSGTWTLTGTGTVSAGITIINGTLSYGDEPTDTLAGTSEITIDPNTTLQLNHGAKIIGSACEIFTGGTLRGTGTLQAPIISIGTIIPTGGTLTLASNANLTGEIKFPTPADKLAVTGDLELAGPLQLPTNLLAGRHLLITHTGTLSAGDITFTNVNPSLLATLDLSTPGEIAVNLIDQSAYQTWQIENFGSLINPDGRPNTDPDNDGMTNLEEFEAGTDPNDATSFIPLIWQGAPNNRWDLATTAAWLENTTTRVFRNPRHVIINDSGSNTPALDLLGTLQPGSIAISNSTKAFTLSGTGSISGPTGLTKSGTNTLTLATPNTYTGPTTINAGVVNIQNNTALGSSTGATSVALNARLELQNNITVTGEPLEISGTGGTSFFNGALTSKSGTNTWAGPLTLATTGTRIGAQTNSTLTISGPITSAPESTGLIIRLADPTATVILSGPNTYAGETTIIGGTLKLGASNTLPPGTALKFGLSNVSGKLDLNGHNQEIAGFSPISGSANEITSATPATLTVNTASASAVPVPITGSAALTQSGPATLTLSSTHTYTGPTTVASGKLLLDLSTLATPTNLLNPLSALNLSGGNLELKGKPTTATTQTFASPTLAPNTSSTITLTPNGSTSTHLTLGDTWTIGENATLLIDLSAGNCAVFSNPTLTGGFLPDVTVKDTIATGPATVVAGQIVRYVPPTLTSSSNDPTLEFSTLNSAFPDGTLTWTDGGLLTNRAVHRLILDTTNTGGTIDLGISTNILTLSSGEIQFLGTNNLLLTGGQLGATASAVSLTTAGTATLTLASPISSGTGSLSITGTANVILNSPNTFPGGLTLNGGTLTQGVANSLGSINGTLTLNSGSLDLNSLPTNLGTLTGLGGSITSPTATTLTLGNTNATGGNFAGSISGPIALTKTGTGTQILSGNNPYTGLTTVSAGTLRSGADHAIGNGNLTISGGTLDLQSFSETVAALTLSSGSISGSSGLLTASSFFLTTGTLSASIGGPSATLAKSGSTYTNTATLSGANTYGGTTTLGTNSGSLVIAHNSALGDTPSVDVVGSGTALVLANNITITGKPITIRGTGANSGTNLGSFGGSLTTAASATATWTGSITLGDSNGRLGSGNSGTLHLSGPILGSGTNQNISLSSGTSSSIGTVVLSGPNNFTGNISIVRGNLKLAATNTLPATAIIDVGSASIADNTSFDLDGFNQTLAGLRRSSTNTTQVSTVTNTSATPATLSLNQSTALSYSGLITGNLTLAKSGAGTLTLSNTNALAASTSVHLDGGALSISSAHTIAALRINGVWQAAGTYNSANSSSRITGSGSLTVTTNGPTGFQSWIDTFTTLTAEQKLPTADPDNDGNSNLLEWALYLDPTKPDQFKPILTQTETTIEYTYTRAKNVQATFAVEWSDTLAADWSTVGVTLETPVSETAATRTVKVSLPTGNEGKRFIRLRISQN